MFACYNPMKNEGRFTGRERSQSCSGWQKAATGSFQALPNPESSARYSCNLPYGVPDKKISVYIPSEGPVTGFTGFDELF